MVASGGATALAPTQSHERGGSPVAPGPVTTTLPEFPSNLTHFVLILRENHVFDDYLGDCSLNINNTCNGGKSYNSTATGTSVETAPSGHQILTPYLHDWARNYSVFDNFYSSIDPWSAQGHNYLFTANVWGGSDNCGGAVEGTGANTQWGMYNGSQEKAGSCSWNPDLGSQTYNSSGGAIFDRFAGPRVAQSKTNIPFLADGDNIWELSSPGCSVSSAKTIPGDSLNSLQIVTGCTNGYWYNTSSGSASMPPTVNPATGIPQFLWECQFSCGTVSGDPSTFLDSYAANSFVAYLKDYGLPTYTEVELQDDHPGSYCGQPDPVCIQWNDAATNVVVSAIENTTYASNTVIAITEDDSQQGQNGNDHVNNDRRLPLVVIAPHTVMKTGGKPSTCGISSTYTSCGFVEHQTFNFSNLLAVMERVDLNVNPQVFYMGGISPNGTEFPMVENDYYAEGNPFEPLWKCGQPGVPCNTGPGGGGSGPAISSFTAAPSSFPLGGTTYLNVSASGGTTPYTYSYSGLPAGCGSTNTSSLACTPTGTGSSTVTVTVTDAKALSTTSQASFTVNPSGGGGNPTVTSFTASPSPISVGATSYLNVTASGGTPPYTYVYTGLPTGCTTSNTTSLACTPSVSGSFTVTVTVTDAAGHPGTGTATLTVNPVAGAPTISSFVASPPTIAPGGTTYLNVSATGGVTPYAYAYSGLPAGCNSLNAASVPCTPTVTSGTFSVLVTVTGSNGLATSTTASFTVSSASPVLSSVTLVPTSAIVPAGSSQKFFANALDQFGHPLSGTVSYQWSVSASSLGSVNPATGGNSTIFTAGSQPGASGSILVIASQGTATAQHTATLSVLGVTATESATSGSAPLSVSFTASANGGTAPYTYQWSFGDGNSSLSQNPTHSYAQPGTYTASVAVTDAQSHTVSQSLGVITVTGGSGGSPIITSFGASTASAPLGTTVYLNVTATGGSTPYTYAYTNLPTGCGSYDTANFPCTPTVTGAFRVTVTVTDNHGLTATRAASFNVTVANPNGGNNNNPSGTGFSLTDLLVVGLVIALMAVLLVVLLRRGKKSTPPPQPYPPPPWASPPPP